MTELLLTEEVFLLGHDDDSGRNTMSLGLAGALAGALLLDLALHDSISVKGKDDIVAAGPRPEHELLATAYDVVAAEQKVRAVGTWLSLLPRRIDHLDQQVGRSLVARGILGEQHAKVLGMFSTTRWPEVDPVPEEQLRARLASVLLERSEPTDDDIALIALLQSYNSVRGLVDKVDRKQASKTAEALRKRAENGDVVSRAIGDTVRATQVAILTSIVAANAATIATS